MTPPLTDGQRVALDAIALALDERQPEKALAVLDAWDEAHDGLPRAVAVFRASALMALGRYDEARETAERIAAGATGVDGAGGYWLWSGIGHARARTGDPYRALSAYRRALRCRVEPDRHEVLQAQAMLGLAVTDDWRRYWAQSEARLQTPKGALPDGLVPWDGRTPGRVIAISEQGYGDTILAARWLRWVAQVSGQPVGWAGPPSLAPWVAGLGGYVEVVDLSAGPPAGAYGVRLLSLPHLSGLTVKERVPEPVAPVRWTRPRGRRLRVGLNWRGAAENGQDFERSTDWPTFAPLVEAVAGVEWVNLCHGADVPEDAPFARVDFADWGQTAAAIASCDVVVTVETAIAHAAGSIGVPTLCLVTTVPDWRWGWPTGTGTPWYPSVTVVRRRDPNDWSGVRDRVTATLEAYRMALPTATHRDVGAESEPVVAAVGAS